MNVEQHRLQDLAWKNWGPYVSNRQWATVREDYSDNGQAWDYTTYETAMHTVYRWGEDGIAGICDYQQLLCFAISLWNKKDPIIKERLFGLTNKQGNHGEDVKELYYYLDSTPTHSYMKMLYKYPQEIFPYRHVLNENERRNRQQSEYEITDTGIFHNNNYFDVFIEYAKNNTEDILIRFTIHNRSNAEAALNVLPTIWFRNTWNWGDDPYEPSLEAEKDHINVTHKNLSALSLYTRQEAPMLFCDNETNLELVYKKRRRGFYKDGINDFIVDGKTKHVNKQLNGTKAAFNYDVSIPAGSSVTIDLRLGPQGLQQPFADFDHILQQRKAEADEFYGFIQRNLTSDDAKLVQRQALAGMLWNKQFYYYDVDVWLNGDPQNTVAPSRKYGRNHRWQHLHNADIISMPDKWEYPWYAAWDLAFHCIPLALVDVDFAKQQLLLLTKDRCMHPNGQLPAYEWDFGDVNPPVHAWAAWEVYRCEQRSCGNGDLHFLESIFHKLLINFTWWVNRKDKSGNNIFQGGFLGLDNIGVFDRNTQLSNGSYIEQADGTSWMAMYCLNMLRISLELSNHNAVYENMATKFFEHFLYIAGAMAHMGEGKHGLWDNTDGFFYDQIRSSDDQQVIELKIRSMVGLIPLFAVELLDDTQLQHLPSFTKRMHWFMHNRPDLAKLVTKWQNTNENAYHLLSLVGKTEIIRILQRMLDETEFLSDYGIRSLSKYHKDAPFEIQLEQDHFSIEYVAGESVNSIFGGNSNWRGPIWFPLNFMLIESLRKFHGYYHDDLKVECPTGSGKYLTLKEVAQEITQRLCKLFLRDEHGRRTCFGEDELLQQNEHFKDYLFFHEYFNGDDGKGLGASQQTGWTGLIAELLKRI